MTKSTSNPGTEMRPALPKNLAIWLVAAGAGLLLVILLVVAVSRSAPAPVLVSAPAPSAVAPDPVVANSEAERRALAKAELQRLQTEGQETRRLLDECDQELAAWEREVEAELTGKRGRSVAADKESLERFSAVYRQSRPSKTELEACRNRVSTLLEPVTAALTSGALHVSSGDMNSKLSTERQFAQGAQQSFRNARQNALSVFTDAERKGTAGTQALKDALAELEARQAQSRVDEITTRHEAARRETTKLIAEARAEQELQYGRDEAARIAQETRRELEKRQADNVRQEAEGTRQRLLDRAGSKAVQDKYQPFLGKSKFGSPNNAPGLLSYNYLLQVEALSSLENFVNAGCGRGYSMRASGFHNFRDNDRVHWTYPTTEDHWEEFKRRYAEFPELAPAFIELGLLRE